MKKLMALLSAVCLVFIFSGVSQAARYSFTSLSDPNAIETWANGISGSNIVGYYTDSVTYAYYGFLYDGSTWTQLKYPGAYNTYANGIDGSNIVGYYYASGYHGFLYDGSTWTQLEYPGATDTYAYGISGSNVVGYYTDSSGDDYGFLYDGSTWTQLEYPGATETYAYGISGSNVVGSYTDLNGKYHGFLCDVSDPANLSYSPLDYPPADAPSGVVNDTYAYGIDGSNIVGSYTNLYGDDHGFLYDGNTWTELVDPNGVNTWAYGISGSNIVGTNASSSITHLGFLAQPAPELDVTPSTQVVNFGSVALNSCSAPQEFTLSNPSTFEVDVSDIALSDTANFTLDLNGGSNPCGAVDPTIASENSCTVTVQFCPATAGQYDFQADLSVASNDPTSPVDVQLAGESGCIYYIAPSDVSVKWRGSHHVAIDVTATGANDCPTPDVATSDTWINISRTRWRNNSGVVVLDVQKNTTSQIMIGTVDIGDKTLTIDQDAASTGK